MKVLITGDDASVLGALVPALVGDGHSVDVCPDDDAAVARARTHAFDLLVASPAGLGGDARGLVRRVRAIGRTEPVLLISTVAMGVDGGGSTGFDAGADDVVTAPVDPRDVLARARSLVERAAGTTRMRSGTIEIDRLQRRAWLDGQLLGLTAREYDLLAFLVEHAGRVVTGPELLARLQRSEATPASNLVQVHVSRLREKLGEYAAHVETVRGVGYRLRG